MRLKVSFTNDCLFFCSVRTICYVTDCKDVIRSRDREIRELTQVTNKLEEKLNDVSRLHASLSI